MTRSTHRYLGESDNDYYSRLDREFEASPYTQAARLLAAIDAGERR